MDDLGPSLHDLHAAIGETLMIWGWLEGEMIAAGVNWRQAAPVVDADAPLSAFLTALVEPRAVRNAIAHGLASGFGDPWSDREPHVTCRTLDGTVRTLTLGDLKRTQAQLEKMRYLLRTTLA